jgi:hypothetical protein
MPRHDPPFPSLGASEHQAPGDLARLPELIPPGTNSGARVKRSTTVAFATTPVVKRHRRRAIPIVLGVAFWLALAVGGTSLIVAATNSTARDEHEKPPGTTQTSEQAVATYIEEADAFGAAWSPEAIAGVGGTSIGITLETKYDEFSQTDRAYAALGEQCAAHEASAARLEALAANPPPAALPADVIAEAGASGVEAAETARRIAPLAAAASALLDEGGRQLDLLSGLCDSLTRLEPIAAQRAAGTAESVTPLMVQPGASEQVQTSSGTVEFACTGDVPCQPLASPAREDYASAVGEVNTAFDRAASEFYTTHCPTVELEEYCAQASALWNERASIDTEAVARFAKETPLNSAIPLPEYTAWLQATDARLASSAAALDAWLAEHRGGAALPAGQNAFVTFVEAEADEAEHRVAELRDAASAAAGTVASR